MFKKLKNKIEQKRTSKSLFWRSLLLSKDIAWRSYELFFDNSQLEPDFRDEDDWYEFLQKIKKSLEIKKLPKIVIETGTFRGDSTEILSKLFLKVHTIEIDPSFYKYVEMKFKNAPNIKCHFGNSVKILPKLLSSIKEPVVFFLDAHHIGGNTPQLKKYPCPLLSELTLIGKRQERDLIIIDDYNNIGKKIKFKGDGIYKKTVIDWRDITVPKIRRAYDRLSDELILEDSLILYPNKKKKNVKKI